MATTKNDFWEVWAPEHYIMTAGTAEQVREEIEEKLEDALGFFVMIEHNDEEIDEHGNHQFRLYLHTDNENDRTDEEFRRLDELGIRASDSEEAQHKAICAVLGISVTR